MFEWCAFFSGYGSDEDEDPKAKRKRMKKEAKRNAKQSAEAQNAVEAQVKTFRMVRDLSWHDRNALKLSFEILPIFLYRELALCNVQRASVVSIDRLTLPQMSHLG